ncbi:hypothetical protein HYZ05_02625 [Candidatus Daviesbacteria bacterium]|nr:hypothetical protein [Candidatus Daviesbacteria bacterium]
MTIIKKFEPEEIKKDFPKKYIVLTVLGLLFLTVLEIWVNNTVVTYGEKFESMSQLERVLEMENQILENEIAKGGSLNSLASKSAELGFLRVESIQYIR